MTITTKKVLQSFIIVPLLATSLSVNTLTTSIDQAVRKVTTPPTTVSAEALALQKTREEEAAKIDAYYTKYNMPLAGSGMSMVLAAEKHGLDWRLLPAIAVRESTGCKFIIPKSNNCFGWGSGKISFKSYDESIETIASHLGGDDPRTKRYYDGKDTLGILKAYNSVIPTYTKEILGIMSSIDKTAA